MCSSGGSLTHSGPFESPGVHPWPGRGGCDSHGGVGGLDTPRGIAHLLWESNHRHAHKHS